MVHSLYQLTNLYQGRNGVLILKQYLNGRWVALSIFLALLAGFSIPFNTWSYSEFFALMGRRQPNRVWPEIFAIAVIVILFALIEYAYQRALNRNVAIFNQKVREHLLTADFIQTNQAGVADRLSYLTNDLTVVENNYLRQIFNIIRSIVTVVVTLAFALRSNYGLTLIFIAFASITPFTPKLLAKKNGTSGSAVERPGGAVYDVYGGCAQKCGHCAALFGLRLLSGKRPVHHRPISHCPAAAGQYRGRQ